MSFSDPGEFLGEVDYWIKVNLGERDKLPVARLTRTYKSLGVGGLIGYGVVAGVVLGGELYRIDHQVGDDTRGGDDRAEAAFMKVEDGLKSLGFDVRAGRYAEV